MRIPIDGGARLAQFETCLGYCLASNRFRRRWGAATATWRSANPSNPSSLRAGDKGTMVFTADTPYPLVHAYGVIPVESQLPAAGGGRNRGLKLFLGLLPEGSCRYPGYFPIPERLEALPLNFIYQPLCSAAPAQLGRNDIILGFHGFRSLLDQCPIREPLSVCPPGRRIRRLSCP